MTPDDPQAARIGFIATAIARAAWLVIPAAIAAALVANGMIDESETSVTARQPMALRDVQWQNLTSTHERNFAWVAENRADILGNLTDQGVDVTVDLPDDTQNSAFAVSATAPTEELAVAGVTQVAQALADTSFDADTSVDDLDALNESLVEARARADELGEQALAVRKQRDEIIQAEGDRVEIDTLFQEARLLDIERERWQRAATDLEVQIATIETDPSLPNEVIGTPSIDAGTVFSSGPIAATAAAFVVAVLGAMLAVGWARWRGKVRSVGGLHLVAPGLTALSLTKTTGLGRAKSEIDPAQLAHLSRLVHDRSGSGEVAIVNVDDGQEASTVAELLRGELGANEAQRLVAGHGETADIAAARSSTAVLVASYGSCRASALRDRIERVQSVGAEILAIVLVGAGLHSISRPGSDQSSILGVDAEAESPATPVGSRRRGFRNPA